MRALLAACAGLVLSLAFEPVAVAWFIPVAVAGFVLTTRGLSLRAGFVVGERTIRRALRRLGYRWKRPQYVLGRPDPAYAEKKGP